MRMTEIISVSNKKIGRIVLYYTIKGVDILNLIVLLYCIILYY